MKLYCTRPDNIATIILPNKNFPQKQIYADLAMYIIDDMPTIVFAHQCVCHSPFPQHLELAAGNVACKCEDTMYRDASLNEELTGYSCINLVLHTDLCSFGSGS